MTVYLPDRPPARQTWKTIAASNVLNPAFGGDELDLQRKGSKYEFAYDYGEMDYLESLDWSDLDIEGATVIAPIFQPGLDTGEPGAPVVNGAGQIGRYLRLRGMRAGYVIRKGQFLAVFDGGIRHFTYRASAHVTVAADGTVTVPLYTLLRRPHTEASIVKIKDPVVEGYPREVSDREVGDNHNVSVSFKVRERG